MLNRVKLFNELGGDSFSDQTLFGGNPTGISNLNNIRYGWVNPLYRTMVGNFWLPQKVSLVEDKLSVKTLTAEEDQAVRDTLSFLIFLDSFQSNNLPNVAEYITCPGVKNLIAIQTFQEVIHSETYQYIMEALYPSVERDEIYNRWRTNENLMKRNKFVASIADEFVDSPTEENLHKVLVANLVLEGVYFYQGFNLFDQLGHRGKIVGTSKEIDYIRRDELTHVGIFTNMIKEVKPSVELVHSIFEEGATQEIDWCKSTYGNKILGISETSSSAYVKWLVNERLGRIGYPSLYDSVDNPYKHITDSAKEGNKRENFFETSVTSYDMADSVDGWDDL